MPVVMKSTIEYVQAFGADPAWVQVADTGGQVWQRTLAEDPKTGDYTRLTRFQDGANTAELGPSVHDYPEEVFVIAGRLYDEAFDVWLEPGHYASRPAGETHGPFRAKGEVWVLEVSFPSQSPNAG